MGENTLTKLQALKIRKEVLSAAKFQTDGSAIATIRIEMSPEELAELEGQSERLGSMADTDDEDGSRKKSVGGGAVIKEVMGQSQRFKKNTYNVVEILQVLLLSISVASSIVIIYSGTTLKSVYCSTPIASWLIIQGSLCLIMVFLCFPPVYYMYFQVVEDMEKPYTTPRVILFWVFIFLLVLILLIWWLVGAAWIFQSELSCHNQLSHIGKSYQITGWVLGTIYLIFRVFKFAKALCDA